jgi:hypothetical protein
MTFCTETEKNPKIHTGPQMVKIILRKNKAGDITSLDFEKYFKNCTNQNSIV